MKYFVYIHKTPNNKFYVGVTTMAPKERWRNGGGYRANKHFYSAIQKYGWDNISHEVFEVDNEDNMYHLEQLLIFCFRSNEPQFGYNKSVGGEKIGLKYRTDKERRTAWGEKNKQYRKQHMGHWMKQYMKKWREEHQDYHKKWSEEHQGYYKKWNEEHPNYFKDYYKKIKT